MEIHFKTCFIYFEKLLSPRGLKLRSESACQGPWRPRELLENIFYNLGSQMDRVVQRSSLGL